MSDNFTCNSSNLTMANALKDQSINVLDKMIYSYCITCGLALIGIANNVTLLVMFYHMNYFRNSNITLFWNLAIVDLMACFSAFFGYFFSVYHKIMGYSDVQSELRCFNKMFAFNTMWCVSQRFALAIALDRLLSKWDPLKWRVIGGRFRKVCVFISWIWAIIQMTAFLTDHLIGDTDECIAACMGCITYPESWVQIEGAVTDNVVNVLIVFIYIVTPCAVSLRIRRYRKALVVVNPCVNALMTKLAFMSGKYIACFIGTMGIGVIFGEVVLAVTINDDPSWILICEAVCSNFVVLNSVLPFYIWMLCPTFRRTILSKASNMFCRRGKKKVFQVCNKSNS